MKVKLSFFQVFLAATLILSCCTTETAIQEMVRGSASSPVFLECKALSSTEIAFRFSRPVTMVSLFMEPFAEIVSYEEGDEILVTLSEPLKEGERVIADILVQDEGRNTLNVLVPFRARNDRVPKLVINELKTENSKPKAEYVEFLAKSSGNIGALRLFIAYVSNSKPVYEFPPVEVAAGERIVLHLRSTEEGCVDETGSNLALSGGTDSSSTARDFWIFGNEKLLHRTDIVYLVDQDDRIIDTVLFSEKPDDAWGRNNFTAAAELIAAQGAWLPRDGKKMEQGTYVLTPQDAVSSSGMTGTKSICRDETMENTHSAQNWYITATSGATPGTPNKPVSNTTSAASPNTATNTASIKTGSQPLTRGKPDSSSSLPRNDNMPDLVINELRTVNSKPKAEFVELLAKSHGNLGGMRLFMASTSITEPVYVFPFAEINEGEYIVLHLRSTEEGCVDETGSDLGLSGGTDSSPAARDLWIQDNKVLIHNNDVVYLMDQDGKIIDAVLLSDNTTTAWGGTKAQNLTTAAGLIASQRAWFPRSGEMVQGNYVLTPLDAVSSSGTTNTRTICRDEIQGNTRSAESWYITANSNATPGKPNSSKRYNN